MSVFDHHFYHGTMRQYMGAFGSVFSKIKISRHKKDSKPTFIVPIANVDQEQSQVDRDQNVGKNNNEIPAFDKALPRMSYALTGWERDVMRQVDKRTIRRTVKDATGKTIETQYNRVPYRFSFTLYIETKYMDDMFQIVEPIMAFFNPSLNIRLKENDLGDTTDLNLTLLDSSRENFSLVDYSSTKSRKAEMEFVLDGYLYLPTMQSKTIHTVIIDYKDLETGHQLDHQEIK